MLFEFPDFLCMGSGGGKHDGKGGGKPKQTKHFSGRAFVHWYVGEGMEESPFEEH